MTIRIEITAETGPEALAALRSLLTGAQAASPAAEVKSPEPFPGSGKASEEAPKEEKKAAKKKTEAPAKAEAPAKEEKEEETQEAYTHAQALDIIKRVAASFGTGEENEKKGIAAAAKIIKSFGDSKVSKLPEDKLKPFIEECKKALAVKSEDSSEDLFE